MSIDRWTILRYVPLALVTLLTGCQVHLTIGPPSATVSGLASRLPLNAETFDAVAGPAAPKVESLATAKKESPSIGRLETSESPERKTVRQTTVWKSSDPLKLKPDVARPLLDETDDSSDPPIHEESVEMPTGPALLSGPVIADDDSQAPANSDPTEITPDELFPVDLPTVLRLAGANNWDIQLATERVREAQARLDAAKVLWLPSLVGGVGYNKHDGQIQATEGEVIDVSRNSLFVGGGAGVSGAPLTGASGGPARFFVDLSLADAIFEPLAARRLVQAEEARESVTLNDTLQEASLAYYDLIGAQGLLAITRENLKDAEEISKLTETFVAAGKGSQADTARARVELSARQQEIIRAEMAVKVAAAELVRILQLEAETSLYALEEKPVAVELVRESDSLSALIANAQMFRPEIAERQARLEASDQRVRAERWRPLIPSIHLGASAGGFGGGVGDNIQNLDGRGDFDILAVWQLKNLGFGTQAARDQRSSQYRQALLENFRIHDVVAAEVSVAYHQVHAERERLKLAEENVEQALESYDKNIKRIRGLEGLPLEALQAIQALATARQTYLAVIVEYNQAQIRLLRATGQSMTGTVPEAVPVDRLDAVPPVPPAADASP